MIDTDFFLQLWFLVIHEETKSIMIEKIMMNYWNIRLWWKNTMYCGVVSWISENFDTLSHALSGINESQIDFYIWKEINRESINWRILIEEYQK